MRTWAAKSILALFLATPCNLFGAAELEKLTDVRLIENPSNDGDSFVVQAGTRQLHLRLYFADCPESVATTDADAKRVREQARYFGIADAKKVFEFGREAKAFTKQTLSKPFTVYTSFADALGRSAGGRIYAFVITSDGNDLARLLVENGFARAYGTHRTGPDGSSSADIQKQLQDLESEAMLKRKGIWAATDPEVIVKLRAEQREEERELKDLQKESSGKQFSAGPVDLNTGTTQELQAISGIGPVLAAKIIAGRPYKSVDDLLRVFGIGPETAGEDPPESRRERFVEASGGREVKSAKNISIQLARLTHLDLLLPLFDAYRQFYKQRSDVPGARKFLRERLKRDESVIFLAIQEGEALGFVQLYPSFDSVTMRRVWILYDLFVTPAARKRGVAKSLMERSRRLAVDTRAKGLILETAIDNRPAQKLYEQLGWKRDMAFHRYCLDV